MQAGEKDKFEKKPSLEKGKFGKKLSREIKKTRSERESVFLFAEKS